jgi:hypothetical protein
VRRGLADSLAQLLNDGIHSPTGQEKHLNRQETKNPQK